LIYYDRELTYAIIRIGNENGVNPKGKVADVLGGRTDIPRIGVSRSSSCHGKVDGSSSIAKATNVNMRFSRCNGLGWLKNGIADNLGTAVDIVNRNGKNTGW